MNLRLSRAIFALVAAACALAAYAAVIGTGTAAQSITVERVSALPAAQQSAWRDYLARSARQMETDRAFLEAELKAAGVTSESIPPSGSSAKSLPLNKPAEWYGSAEARHIADIVVSFQTPAGGWSKNIDLTDHLRRQGEAFAPNNLSAHLSPGDFDTPHDAKWNYVGTLDNDATTTEMRFLAKVAAVQGKPAESYRTAVLRGLDYVFAAQFPNGGWPQVWPLEGGYHDAITFNDGAVTETLELLQSVADGKDQFAFVPAKMRARAQASVDRGIDTILATQISGNGRRTVWAQQHDALNLQPVAGRNYEPAAQCASESASMMLFLMKAPQPKPEVVAAVYSAAAWFRKTAIYGVAYERGADGRRLTAAPGAGPIWARYYEIGSDRPIFGDRDQSIHDDVNELSLERRNGYSWYNAAPVAALDRFGVWSASHPPAK
jgi:PelA/Pel-15E family pectate lyase